MAFDINEVSKNSKGGTELMRIGLEARSELARSEEFQIIPSRVRELKEDKIRVLWLHDLPGDPESEHLHNGGHEKFHVIVCVSNWQMQQYASYYRIPWSKFIVIENAIQPIPSSLINKPTDKIKIIYHTTPHRGLELVVPVFELLAEKYDNIELDVFSSFNIYGWPGRDEPYREIFDRCINHPRIHYHGTVPNEQVREALGKAHIFAYPSIWAETSCISLMEAMSAECICLHPNYAALYETAGGTTFMYQFHEDPNAHAQIFMSNLDNIISKVDHAALKRLTTLQSGYANLRYTWDRIVPVWEDLLRSLLERFPNVEDRKLPEPTFFYKAS